MKFATEPIVNPTRYLLKSGANFPSWFARRLESVILIHKVFLFRSPFFTKLSSNSTPTMMTHATVSRFWWLLLAGLIGPVSADLASGDRIGVTLRGVPAAEQEKVNGKYQVGESGTVRLPLLNRLIPARGLSPEQFARAAEAAYKHEGIYDRPAIEVETLQGGDQGGEAVISVGGQVRRAGQTPFRKNMTVIQALDSAGGRNDFGSRNVLLLRGGKQYCLDFTKLRHKNIILRPGDSLQVEQKGIIDRWKGSEATMKDLQKRE